MLGHPNSLTHCLLLPVLPLLLLLLLLLLVVPVHLLGCRCLPAVVWLRPGLKRQRQAWKPFAVAAAAAV
jgi:hypothetical protein